MSKQQKIPYRLLAFVFAMTVLLGLIMPLFTITPTGVADDAEQLNLIDSIGTAGGMVFGAKEDGDYIDCVTMIQDLQASIPESEAARLNTFAVLGVVFLVLTPVGILAAAILLQLRKKKLLPLLFAAGGLLSLLLTHIFFSLAAAAAHAGGSSFEYAADSGFWVTLCCFVLTIGCMLLYQPAKTEEAPQTPRAVNTQRLTETAILIALGTILSEIKVITVPFGGGITICAMVPLILLSYRWGLRWGFFSSFVFGVFQMLLGIAKHSFGFDLWIVILDILLEYILAYTLLALGGVFRNKCKSPVAALSLGGALAVFARYFVHFVAGFLFWGSYAVWFFTDGAGVSIGDLIMGSFQGAGLSLVYSGIFNGSLMLGEMILTVVALAIIGKVPQLAVKKD